jgi:hypothetical protein
VTQNLTGRGSVVAKRLQNLLIPLIGDDTFCDPAIQGVSYGDQEKIPASPWLCIEPNDKVRDWPPTPTDMTEVQLQCIIFVYHTNVTGGNEQTRYECDVVAEAVEEYFNVNHRQLRDESGNDLVIYSYCIRNESGYTTRNRTMYRASRITWQARSKMRLTQAQ